MQEFLTPSSLCTHSPYILDNIIDAVNKIVDAIDTHKQITVFMDFDCDGVCSGTMMYRFLKQFTDNVDYLIFPRSTDHGLKRKIIPPTTELLIVVDAGTNDVAECLALQDRGIDVVIIDHHPATVDNPHAIIVNNQMGDYPNRTLSGSGVVLKVLEALSDTLGTLAYLDYYDLAAIGIIGDMMSLTDLETRAIVYQGLETVRNEGVKQILKKQRIFDLRNLTTMQISFSLVPVINAATRMNESKKIVELMLCDDPEEVNVMANECIALNKTRKEKQVVAVDNLVFDNSHNIILCVENNLAGNMRGLIANNIANEHQKPAIVVKLNTVTNVYEGSGRGYNTVSFKDILTQSGLVESAEGHDNAFGVQIHKDNMEKLVAYCDDALLANEQVLNYDLELGISEIDSDVISQIEQFNRITGKDCEPLKVKVVGFPVSERKVNAKGNVVTLVSDTLNAVKFGTSDMYANDVGSFDTVDMLGKLSVNKWWHNGIKQWVIDYQIIVDDYTKQQEA